MCSRFAKSLSMNWAEPLVTSSPHVLLEDEMLFQCFQPFAPQSRSLIMRFPSRQGLQLRQDHLRQVLSAGAELTESVSMSSNMSSGHKIAPISEIQEFNIKQKYRGRLLWKANTHDWIRLSRLLDVVQMQAAPAADCGTVA